MDTAEEEKGKETKGNRRRTRKASRDLAICCSTILTKIIMNIIMSYFEHIQKVSFFFFQELLNILKNLRKLISFQSIEPLDARLLYTVSLFYVF